MSEAVTGDAVEPAKIAKERQEAFELLQALSVTESERERKRQGSGFMTRNAPGAVALLAATAIATTDVEHSMLSDVEHACINALLPSCAHPRPLPKDPLELATQLSAEHPYPRAALAYNLACCFARHAHADERRKAFVWLRWALSGSEALLTAAQHDPWLTALQRRKHSDQWTQLIADFKAPAPTAA